VLTSNAAAGSIRRLVAFRCASVRASTTDRRRR
jgi:hypothetical protein